ncbi:MAG: radical SAM protein [bacterium]|nr:radical SAM protein [bacterium]
MSFVSTSQTISVKPRGIDAMLPHGALPEMISLYMIRLIEKTGGKNGPLGRQFIASPKEEKKYYQKKASDPLNEDYHEVAPGIVYKYRGKLDKKGNVIYHGRALWTITRFCATYCRFCTRGREVGMPSFVKSHSKASIAQTPYLSSKQIEKAIAFLKNAKEINEVIISGGDPLVSPQPYLTDIIQKLAQLQQKGHLDIIRIGTRLPVHNPIAVRDWHYQLLSTLKNPYIMLHINHPLELTEETLSVLNNFRKLSGATIMSQTVLLKEVNDNVEVLYKLFTVLSKEGVRPYYLFQNDPVYWAQHFTVPIHKAIKIWKKLRPQLSGIAATARFAIDVENGYGKIPVPEGDAWDVDYTHYRDFKGKKFTLA